MNQEPSAGHGVELMTFRASVWLGWRRGAGIDTVAKVSKFGPGSGTALVEVHVLGAGLVDGPAIVLGVGRLRQDDAPVRVELGLIRASDRVLVAALVLI